MIGDTELHRVRERERARKHGKSNSIFITNIVNKLKTSYKEKE